MSYNADTESSKGKRKAKVTSTESTTSASGSSQRWRQTPPTSETSTVRTRRETSAKVTDTDFAESILEPHGIKIQNSGVNKDLYKHFRLQGLPRDFKSRLGAYRKVFELDTWLEADVARIQ